MYRIISSLLISQLIILKIGAIPFLGLVDGYAHHNHHHHHHHYGRSHNHIVENSRIPREYSEELNFKPVKEYERLPRSHNMFHLSSESTELSHNSFLNSFNGNSPLRNQKRSPMINPNQPGLQASQNPFLNSISANQQGNSRLPPNVNQIPNQQSQLPANNLLANSALNNNQQSSRQNITNNGNRRPNMQQISPGNGGSSGMQNGNIQIAPVREIYGYRRKPTSTSTVEPPLIDPAVEGFPKFEVDNFFRETTTAAPAAPASSQAANMPSANNSPSQMNPRVPPNVSQNNSRLPVNGSPANSRLPSQSQNLQSQVNPNQRFPTPAMTNQRG